MRKSYLSVLLSAGVALASFSSCSRANYSFNNNVPAYLGSTTVAAPAVVADEPVLTASVEAAEPVVLAAPARVAATALAASPAAPVAHRVARTSVAKADVATAKAPATTLTKAERKELKQVLRQATSAKKATAPNAVKAEGKSQIVAAVLCFFLGFLGVHRFYLGHIGIGILMLLTFGLFGILTLIDFIRILTGSLKPKNGDYATKI